MYWALLTSMSACCTASLKTFKGERKCLGGAKPPFATPQIRLCSPGSRGCLGGNMPVNWSTPFFPPPQTKTEKSGLASETTVVTMHDWGLILL